MLMRALYGRPGPCQRASSKAQPTKLAPLESRHDFAPRAAIGCHQRRKHERASTSTNLRASASVRRGSHRRSHPLPP
eukprot:705574-Karenia_brevis.AAC.1